jgi:hypothetical protein
MKFLLAVLICFSLTAVAQTKKLGASVNTAVTPPSVTLSCTEAVGGGTVTSNNFYRGTVSGGPYALVGSAATCAFNDTTPLFNTTYYYTATAVNGSTTCPTGQTCESPYSNQVTAVVGASPIPGAPTGLTVGTIIATNVPLDWIAPVDGLTPASYGVYRCSKSTCPAPPKIATVNSTAFTDTGCVPTNRVGIRTCYYEVRANDLIAGKLVTSGPSKIVEAIVR